MGLKIPVSLVRFRVRAPLFLTLAFGGGFFVPGNGLSIELRSIIRRRRLTPSGPAQALFKNAPGVFVRVRAPLFLTLAFGGGFFVPGNGLSIELRSIIRRRRLTPSGPAQALFKNAPGVFVRVRAPLFLTLAFGGGFFVLGNGLSIELRSMTRHVPATRPASAIPPQHFS